MEISCAFPPSPAAPDHVVLAEELGYARAWCYDSPALYPDVWVTLARCAERTARIGLGPAVLIPSLRHPVAQASAIATLADLAPGRVVAAIGTGFTGRMTFGQPPLRWADVERYVAQVRGLLRGETVAVDGAACRLIASPGVLPERPVEVPLLVAANGPKGLAVAREHGDGVMTMLAPQPGFAWSAHLVLGTVLDAGEPPTSARALAAAGPALTVVYHAMYEADPALVDGLPGGPEWRAELEAIPEAERHLALHEGHLVTVTDRDARLLDGNLLPQFSWTGEAGEVRARAGALAAAGTTELVYAPMGPDVPRELRRFLDAVRG